MAPLQAWQREAHGIHGGVCPYCERHFKSAHNWMSHVQRIHADEAGALALVMAPEET